MMKRLIAMLLVVVMLCTVCVGCGTEGQTEDTQHKTIGYVIVPHYDGDEHIAIYKSYADDGIVWAWCVDGRVVKGTTLIVVENN